MAKDDMKNLGLEFGTQLKEPQSQGAAGEQGTGLRQANS